MAFNIMKLVFGALTLNTVLISSIFFINESCLPQIFREVIRYGKFIGKTDTMKNKLKVPKRFFRHFYAFAAPILTICLLMAIGTYFFSCELPEIFYNVLDLTLGSSRSPYASPAATLIALTAMTIHVWKRYYETHYVSIFSNATITITIYAIGFIHYIGVITTIIGESYNFVRGTSGIFNWKDVSNVHLICAAILLIASYEQLQSNFILANLRKNKDGNISTEAYNIPTGRLFEYISTPLQFTEIIIYVMLSIILWGNSTVHYVTMWVLGNQVATGILQHQWYKETFENYPKTRKTIIPFIF